MGKSISLAIRLPLGVYDGIKKAVDEKKLASSYSGFCRQVITERIIEINSVGAETESISDSDSEERITDLSATAEEEPITECDSDD